MDRLANLQHVLVPRRKNEEYQVSLDYEFTKEKLKELDWPPCGTRPPPIGPPIGTDDQMPQEDIDPLGSDAIDATKLFPNLVGNESTAAGTLVSGNQSSADETDVEDDDGVLPDPVKKWPRDIPKPPASHHLYYAFDPEPDDPPDEDVPEMRFQGILKSSSAFVSHWRQPPHEQKPGKKDFILKDSEMNDYVAKSFKAFGWGTDAEFSRFINGKKRILDKDLALFKNEKLRAAKMSENKAEIERLKRERKQYRRALEKEFKFGRSALVVGLKYNPSQDKFFARINYVKNSIRGHKQEEDVLVPPWWIQSNKYRANVIQHVINMGQTDNGYVMVPPGMNIHVQDRAISQLKYVPPSTRTVPIGSGSVQAGNSIVRGKQLRNRKPAVEKIEAVPHHWLIKYSGESKALRVDDDFLSAFSQDFLNEVKRLKSSDGFVDIPVGDFKLSNLHEYPNLIVPNAPVVHFRQSDGQDLCVSKSLASVLHALQFESAATAVNDYGEEIRGTINAIKKIGNYAKQLLPCWINLQRLKSPQEFGIEDCERNPEHIVLAVLIESDGNSSHAVCIHGGFVYDANEGTAIPLCEEAMNYCCSTPTVRNTFVAFKHVTIFYYGGKDPQKKIMMTIHQPPRPWSMSKISHVHQHPNLIVPWAPLIQFRQLDGQDLCAPKSLASALYALGFKEEAVRLNEHWEKPDERKKLAEVPLVNVLAKVGTYARGLLPFWISRTVVRTPQDFDWQNLLHYKWNQILMGILNSSDGSYPRVVTIHGGFVYDANEVHAISLSREALDYCCSTETVKNTFVNFHKVVKFHYEGSETEKRQQMTLTLPGQGRVHHIHDDLMMPPVPRRIDAQPPPAAVMEEKEEDSPPMKRGRGRPKKPINPMQFVHRDDKKKKRKR